MGLATINFSRLEDIKDILKRLEDFPRQVTTVAKLEIIEKFFW